MSRIALAHFGKLLMTQVRDPAIGQWDAILSGTARGISAERVHAVVAPLDNQQREVLYELVPQIVDTILFQLLNFLEQQEGVEISLQSEEFAVPSLRDISDGLQGELWGWIPKFSEKRHDPSLG